jgi:hypothetical protein
VVGVPKPPCESAAPWGRLRIRFDVLSFWKQQPALNS